MQTVLESLCWLCGAFHLFWRGKELTDLVQYQLITKMAKKVGDTNEFINPEKTEG